MEDLGAAVERIMADPAFSKMVKELGGGDGGDLMEKLPRVMETLGPMLGGSVHDVEKGQQTGESSRPGETGESKPDPGGGEQAAPLTSSPIPNGGAPAMIGRKTWNRSDAEKLFLALKPYLGERRRDLADRCVSLMQMGELLKAAGLITGGRP